MITTRVQKKLFVFFLLCLPLAALANPENLKGDEPVESDTGPSASQFYPRTKSKREKRKEKEKKKKETTTHVSDVNWDNVNIHYNLDLFLGPSAESKRMDKAKKWRKRNKKTKQRNAEYITNQSHRRIQKELPEVLESNPLFEQIIACAKEHNSKGSKYGKKYGRRVALGDFESDDFDNDLTEERNEFASSSKCAFDIEKLFKEQYPDSVDTDAKLHKIFGESFEYGAKKMYKPGKELGEIDLQYEKDYKSWREWTRRNGIKVGSGTVGLLCVGYGMFDAYQKDQPSDPNRYYNFGRRTLRGTFAGIIVTYNLLRGNVEKAKDTAEILTIDMNGSVVSED